MTYLPLQWAKQSNLMRSSYRWCTEETGIKSTVARVHLLSNSSWMQVKSRRQNIAIQHYIKPVSCSARHMPASTARGRWEERGVMLDQSWFCISEGWRQADSSPPMSPLGRRTSQLIGRRSCAPFERTHERNAVIKNEDCHFSLKERNKSGKKKRNFDLASRFHWNSLSCLLHTLGSPRSGSFPLSFRDNKLTLLEVTCLTDCGANAGNGTGSECWMVMSILLTLWGHNAGPLMCVSHLLIVLWADMRLARDPARLRALLPPV